MKKRMLCLLSVMVFTLAACGGKEDVKESNGTSAASGQEAVTSAKGGDAKPESAEAYISKGKPEEVLSEENMRAYATAMGGITLTDACTVPVENTSEWDMQKLEDHDDHYSESAFITAEFIPGIKGKYRYTVFADKDGNKCEISEMSAGYIHNSYEDDITIDSSVVCGEYVGKFDYLPRNDSAVDLGEIRINITKAEMPESVFDSQIEGTMTVTAVDGTVYEQPLHGSVGYQQCCLYLRPNESELDFGRGATYLDLDLVYDFENGVFKSKSDYGDVVTNLKKQ